MADDLFAMVLAASAHEMKNSLGLLMNELDDLAVELPAEPAARLSAIQYEAGRINHSLMEMLALYKLDRRQLDVVVDEVVVVDLVEDCVAAFAPLAANRRIDVAIDGDASLVGFFDANLVGIAIANIVGNAIRYAASRIRIAADAADGWLVIRVEDDGDGYPAALLEAGAGSGRGIDIDSGSTGLGLYFARRMAAIHHRGGRSGEIRLANGAGLAGGCFEMRLP